MSMERGQKLRQIVAVLLAAIAVAGCGAAADNTEEKNTERQETKEIILFAAASLNGAVSDIAKQYEQKHPDVRISINADSSGKLMTQIEEGFACDLFFSASSKQMDELIEKQLVSKDRVSNVLRNQLIAVAPRGTETAEKLNKKGTVADREAFEDIRLYLEERGGACSLALCAASVPAGEYARRALMSLGVLGGKESVMDYAALDVGAVLCAEVSEQDNVSKACLAVAEQSCDIGFIYKSDLTGYEDKLSVIWNVDSSLTGDISYPLGVVNQDADECVMEFYQYLMSEESKKVYERYHFIYGL